MGKKEKFVLEIEQALKEQKISLSEDAQIYFEALKGESDGSPQFTENGKCRFPQIPQLFPQAFSCNIPA